jgi:hypothetical protein
MSRICWRLVDRLSLLLARDERDAVRGDLVELRVSAGRALVEVLGLVMRRQAALWMQARPWLALLGLAVPLTMALSLLSRWYAEGAAIHAFMFVDNWTWGVLESPGARRDLARVSATVALDLLALFSWSWTTGFVVGALAGRTRWVHAAACALVLAVEFLAVEQPHHAGHAEVFELTFYSTALPLLLRAALVLAPLWWGARQGARRGALGPLPTMLVAIVIATLTALDTRTFMFAGMFGWWRLQAGWQLLLFQGALVLPAGYMLVAAVRRQWAPRPTQTQPGW